MARRCGRAEMNCPKSLALSAATTEKRAGPRPSANSREVARQIASVRSTLHSVIAHSTLAMRCANLGGLRTTSLRTRTCHVISRRRSRYRVWSGNTSIFPPYRRYRQAIALMLFHLIIFAPTTCPGCLQPGALCEALPLCVALLEQGRVKARHQRMAGSVKLAGRSERSSCTTSVIFGELAFRIPFRRWRTAALQLWSPWNSPRPPAAPANISHFQVGHGVPYIR